MNFELATLSLSDAPAEKSDALLVLLGESFKPGQDLLSRLAGEAIKAQDWEPKGGKLLPAYRVPGVAAPRLMLLGVGDGSARQVRSAVAAAMAALKGAPVKRLSLCLGTPCDEAALRAATLAVAEGSYVYTATKSKPEARKLQRVRLGVPDAGALHPAFERVVAAVAGIECAKEWANRPANHATPSQLAAAAKALAKAPKLQCEVLGPKEVGALGMGAFLAVARGSEEPLRFIVLRYNGAARASAPVVLVGKGITFDTGGISIKPAA